MTRRRWWVVAGAAAVVVIAVGGVVLWQAATRPATAEEAAAEFLEALESGDRAAVEESGVDVSAAALTAFTGATELVDGAEVIAVRASADEAAADVAFRLGGEERTARLDLSRADGSWTVDASALGSVVATAALGSFVSIGDATFPAGEDIRLLPGSYEVSVAPSSLIDGERVLQVLPGASADVAIEAALRPEATDAAQTQLDDLLESCTASADASAEGCGIRIPWGTEFRAVTDIRYRVEQFPTATLTETGFSADGGVLVATVSGTGQDGGSRTTSYRTESWTVRGDVGFTAEKLVLTVW